jgi:hypothetical protein
MGADPKFLQELQIKNLDAEGFKRDAYLQFDVASIPNNHRVERALLKLYGRSYDDVGASKKADRVIAVGAFPLVDPYRQWKEETLTWANRTYLVGYDSLKTSLGYTNVPFEKERWHSIDLTTFVRAERESGRTRFTIGLHAPDQANGVAVLRSAESAFPPTLEIEHAP